MSLSFRFRVSSSNFSCASIFRGPSRDGFSSMDDREILSWKVFRKVPWSPRMIFFPSLTETPRAPGIFRLTQPKGSSWRSLRLCVPLFLSGREYQNYGTMSPSLRKDLSLNATSLLSFPRLPAASQGNFLKSLTFHLSPFLLYRGDLFSRKASIPS